MTADSKKIKLRLSIDDWRVLLQMAKDQSLTLEDLCRDFLHSAADAAVQFKTDPGSLPQLVLLLFVRLYMGHDDGSDRIPVVTIFDC